MKTITFVFFSIITITVFGQQNPNSMKKMNYMAIELSKVVDKQSNLDMIRYESGFMSANGDNFIAALPRVLVANLKYSFVAYADGRIQDFELGVLKKNKDGDWKKVKSVNEHKGEPVTNPVSAINDYETLKDYIPEDTEEYNLYLVAPKAGNRAGRYTVLIYVSGESTSTTTSSNNTNSSNNNTTSSAAYDQTLKKALDETGLKYTISKKGDFYVDVKANDGRTQNVIINSSTQTYQNLEVREMWSQIATVDSKNAIGASNALFFLEQNASLKMGAWQIAGTTAPFIINLSLMISPQTSPTELKKMIEMIGKEADSVEKTMTSKDKF